MTPLVYIIPGGTTQIDDISRWLPPSLDTIGGSRGGGAAACAPPTGSISFVFAYIFTEKCMRRRLAPPQREILDPPLDTPGRMYFLNTSTRAAPDSPAYTFWPLIAQSRARSRIFHGGCGPILGGFWPPMWALFSENVCKNKRIGSCRGACASTPPRSAYAEGLHKLMMFQHGCPYHCGSPGGMYFLNTSMTRGRSRISHWGAPTLIAGGANL